MTAEQVAKLLSEGRLTRVDLAEKLSLEKRSQFEDACNQVDRAFTKTCRDKGETCLADGCAMDDGETCLQAALNQSEGYFQTIANIWKELAD